MARLDVKYNKTMNDKKISTEKAKRIIDHSNVVNKLQVLQMSLNKIYNADK